MQHLHKKSQVKATRRRKLEMQRLESREVFAALSFSAGTLHLNMSEMPVQGTSVFAEVGANNGLVVFNGRLAQNIAGAPGGRLNTAAVRSIVVNGSAFSDVVGLGAVSPSTFPNVVSVTVNGNGGNDTIRGSDTADVIFGGDGDDRIFGYGGGDRIYGNNGNDTIWGDFSSGVAERNGSADWIEGGSGNDTVYGGWGNDWIFGQQGDDSLFGDSGDDTLDGGQGADYMQGDAGFDTAWHDSADVARNRNNFRGIENLRRR